MALTAENGWMVEHQSFGRVWIGQETCINASILAYVEHHTSIPADIECFDRNPIDSLMNQRNRTSRIYISLQTDQVTSFLIMSHGPYTSAIMWGLSYGKRFRRRFAVGLVALILWGAKGPRCRELPCQGSTVFSYAGELLTVPPMNPPHPAQMSPKYKG